MSIFSEKVFALSHKKFEKFSIFFADIRRIAKKLLKNFCIWGIIVS